MALVVKDRVRETTTTTGTGTITLAGAVSGFQSFSVIGNGNTTYYCIYDSTAGTWEVGLGTYTLSGTTLSRDTVLESSNAGSLVNFGAGSKDVFCTYPAEQSVYVSGTSIVPATAAQLGVAYGGTGLSGTPTNGQLPIGNGTGYTLGTLTQGTGITVTNGSGSITVTNASPMTYPGAGIANSTGSAWGTSYTTSGSGTVVALATGASLTTPSLSGETFSTSATVSAAGTTQGTATALTSDYNVITTAASGTGVALPTATTGRRVVVVNKGTNAVNVYPASGGTIDALAVNAAISLPVSGVLIFNASSTTQWYSSVNLLQNTSLLSGTVAVANGGTGQTSYTDGQLLIGNSTGNTLTKATLTAGTNVTITNGSGSITIAASGGGATGGGTDKIFWQNDQTVTTSYSITAGQNAGTFGPVTVNSGATVTVPSGSVWTVV